MKNLYPHFCAGLCLAILFFFSPQSRGSTLMPSGVLADTTELTICNNQLPYSWNGLTLLSGGTYTAYAGTDSAQVLHLLVNNVGTSITNAVICTSQLPYHWNGQTYTHSGTYSVTLTSANGCDSVPILSLTVNDEVRSTTNLTLCSNETPFVWNGNSYTQSGTYTAVLTSQAGCDSIATLNLIIKPEGHSLTTVNTCTNRLPYIWNGHPYAAQGLYSLTLPGANGCDSVAQLQLNVHPVGTSITRVSVCANELPYQWNGSLYVSPGSYRKVLTGASGCDSVLTLVLTVLPVPNSLERRSVCPLQLPINWNGQTISASGIYSVTLTASTGCDSLARLQLTVTDTLRTVTDLTLCITDLPYLWNGQSINLPGTYRADFVTAAGCDSISIINVTLQNHAIIIDTAEICPEELPLDYHGQIFTSGGLHLLSPPVVLNACNTISHLNLVVKEVVPGSTRATVCENNLPYRWNGQNFDSAGTYTLTLTAANGCDSLDILILDVIPFAGATDSVEICSSLLPFIWNGEPLMQSGDYSDTLRNSNGCDSLVRLNLTVNPAYRDTAQIQLCAEQLPFTWNNQSITQSGMYTANFSTVAGCDSMSILYVQVNDTLIGEEEIFVCANQLPFIWNGINITSTGIYEHFLPSSSGCDSIVRLNLVVGEDPQSVTTVNTCTAQLPYQWNGNFYDSSGTYSVTLVNAAGCDSIATLELFAHDVTTSFSADTICNNQLPYSWNGNMYSAAGNYMVPLTGSTGCDSLAYLNLVVTDILTSTTNVTVCPAQLPYTWNGNNYNTGGTFAVTITTPNGCDSVPILSLTVAPYVTSESEISVCSNELPYRWNGLLFTAPGTKTDTLTTMAGCDSLATLTLHVVQADTARSRLRVCENEMPYNWNGMVLQNAGIYHHTTIRPGECDSVSTLTLEVLPITTGNEMRAICRSALPLNWNGQTLNDAGTYTATLTGVSGCDSIATLQLVVNEPSAFSETRMICQQSLPLIWNGQTLTQTGNYTALLQNRAGCDSLVQLQLIVSPTITTTSTDSVCAASLPYNWNGQSLTASGIYTHTITSGSGCDSILRLSLTVIPEAETTVQLNLCRDELPLTWNGRNITAAGSYAVVLSGSAGCDSVVSLHLSVAEPTFNHATAQICSADLPYSWNGLNIMQAGVYRDTLLNAAGCDSIISLNLTVGTTPGPVQVLPSLDYCEDEMAGPLLAVADSGNVLLWYEAATGGPGTTTPPVPQTAVPGTTIYYVAQQSNGCEGVRLPVTVTVYERPDLGPDKNLRVCFGETGNLITFVPNNTGLPGAWEFNGQPVVQPSAISDSGKYRLMVVNAEGCADTVEVDFLAYPQLFAQAGEDANVEPGVPYQLFAEGNGIVRWHPAHMVNNPSSFSALATVTSNTQLVLQVTNEIGCMVTDTINLRVLNGPGFYVPSAFTPNGDGLNDVFRPTPVGILKLEYFRIYNRYGELVFETNEIGKGWDGIYKGKPQGTANFVWSLRGTDRFGKVRQMEGNVVLIK